MSDSERREGGCDPFDSETGANDPDAERTSETGYWIVMGNGGTGRALHDSTECPAINASGKNATSVRPASEAEVAQVERDERDMCSKCDGTAKRSSGQAADFSAADIRRMAREGAFDAPECSDDEGVSNREGEIE